MMKESKIDLRTRLLVASVACSLVCTMAGGCYLLKRDDAKPSNNYRRETSGMSATGVDDRARQIESNLGVR